MSFKNTALMRILSIFLFVRLVITITIGKIDDVVYESTDSAATTFSGTCQECICRAFVPTAQSIYVAINCHLLNSTCTLFYNYSLNYRLRTQFMSAFIFYPHPPPISPFVFGWNTTGVTVAGVTGSPGTGANQLNNPFGVALDSSKTLYIADRGNHRVQKWENNASHGATVAGRSTGVTGPSLSDLFHPGNVAVNDNGNLYVTEVFNHRVLFWPFNASSGTLVAGTSTTFSSQFRYRPSFHRLIFPIGALGASNNQLNEPHDIAYDWVSNVLYISEYSNHRVMKYLPNTTSGILVAGGNGPGLAVTQLYNPVGLYLDRESNSLFIANFGAHSVVRWVLGASSWTLVAGVSGVSGSTSMLLYHPGDVSLDWMGNVYVADTYNHRIQFFLAGDSNGTTIAGVTGVPGSGANQLNLPFGVTVDIDFNIYVADYSNHRVQKFLHN